MKLKICLVLVALSLASNSRTFGFRLLDEQWQVGNVPVVLSLGGAALSDGTPSFDQAANDAFQTWNSHLANLQFSVTVNPADPHGARDGVNSVFFSSKVYDEDFGSNTLAVTLSWTGDNDNRRTVETDVLFNTARTWDSYRGPLRNGVVDFRRVALHEFGHVLGLGHPDQAGQNVTAIMDSIISGLDQLQTDDVVGAQYLYGEKPVRPQPVAGHLNNLVNISTRAQIAGAPFDLIVGFIIQGSQPARVMLRGMGPSLTKSGIVGAIANPVLELYNEQGSLYAKNDDWVGNTNADMIIDYGLAPKAQVESALLIDLPAGHYTAKVHDASNQAGVGLVELYDLQATNARAANLSTRGQVLTGENVMIAGFIVGGDQSKTVVIRGIGPSLTDRGVYGALQDPRVDLFNSSGTRLAANDNWRDDAHQQEVINVGLAPTNDKESAMYTTLPPGTYTAIVSGVGGTGVGLVEVYDLSPAP
jgi:hypothetical protein